MSITTETNEALSNNNSGNGLRYDNYCECIMREYQRVISDNQGVLRSCLYCTAGGGPMSTSAPMTTHDGVSKRRIAPLLTRRKQNLDQDGHVSCYDYTDGNGQKIREFTRNGPEGTEKTIRINYSRMLGTAPSTSSNVEVLLAEPRQTVDSSPEEIETMNPHIPGNDDILETATERITDEGLVPAWEVVDR